MTKIIICIILFKSNKNLYGSKLVQIPAPKFVIFYLLQVILLC